MFLESVILYVSLEKKEFMDTQDVIERNEIKINERKKDFFKLIPF